MGLRSATTPTSAAAAARSAAVAPMLSAAVRAAAARASRSSGARPAAAGRTSSTTRPFFWGRADTSTRPGAAAAAAAAAPSAPSASSATAPLAPLYTGPPRVCILGGGFGGLYTAVKLEGLLWPRGGGGGGGASSSSPNGGSSSSSSSSSRSSPPSSSSPLKPRVTLVDKGDRFVFKPLLYELLNGGATAEEVAPTFAQLLAPYDVRFVRARVAAVEESGEAAASAQRPQQPWRAGEPRAAAGRVVLDSGDVVEYDYLVVALGAEADARGVPGVRERAVPFVSLEDAERVKATLEQRVLAAAAASPSSSSSAAASPRQRTIVVVGAGYSGVELATVLAERVRAGAGAGRGGASSSAASSAASSSSSSPPLLLVPPPRVQLVTPGADILEGSPAGQREAARRALSSLGVEVLTGVRVVKLGAVEGGEEGAEGSAAATEDGWRQEGAASGAAAAPLEPCTVFYEASSASQSPGSSAWQQRADLVVWTAGSAPVTAPSPSSRPSSSPPPPAAGRLPLPFPTTPRGTLATEPSLRVVGHPRVFALGDTATASAPASAGPVGDPDDPARRASAPASASASASVSAAAAAAPPPLPATAQVAFQQADYAAWNLWAAITGRPLLPFRYQHLGSMMALGAAQAAVALPFELPADVAARVRASPLGAAMALAGVRVGGGAGGGDGGITVEGPLAQLLRRGAYLYRQPTGEQRLSVAASWIQQAATAAAAAAGARGR